MNITDIPDIDSIPAAQSVNRLFAQIAPATAETVEPFVERLFAALSHGNTFIYISQAEADALAQAAPLVGSDASSPIVLHGRRLFIAKYWHLEKQLAAEIQRLSAHAPMQPEKPLAQLLADWFADDMSRDQRAAAALALLKNFVLISGGPGTGKTTTVAKLLALLHRQPAPRTALVAPTGKAAARLTESLHRASAAIPNLDPAARHYLANLTGQTVHRLLGLKPPQMQPEYHAHNRLPLDCVLIDEASMMDNHLLYQLLAALPSHGRVILLGDADQLPSVGAGAVLDALSHNHQMQPETTAALRQLLPDVEHFPTLAEQHARLTISHRFHNQSGIGNLARAVQQGSESAWQTIAEHPRELSAQPRNPAALVAQLYHHQAAYWQAIQAGNIAAAFAEQSRLIVLTALRHDAEHINNLYRTLLQQHGHTRPQSPWYAGQIIMITRNAPSQKLYNGDIGIIMQPANERNEFGRSQNEQGEFWRSPNGNNDLRAYFPDEQGYRSIPLSHLPEHETAYAITTHKSQGSEYEQVWFAAPAQAKYSRALLYTAITRAKQQFVYWGDEASFQAACAHDEQRNSALGMFLKRER